MTSPIPTPPTPPPRPGGPRAAETWTVVGSCEGDGLTDPCGCRECVALVLAAMYEPVIPYPLRTEVES